jgi:hypothetical protein
VCYLGAGAFRNVYIALLLTVTFSLTFITLRVAWQDDIGPIRRSGPDNIVLGSVFRKAENGGNDEVQENENAISLTRDSETVSLAVAAREQVPP